jgi:sterol 3beta-glucosyltransferase
VKVAVVGAGTRGDIQPIAALAQRLARAGHAVRFIAHPSWRYLTSADASIEFVERDSNDPKAVSESTTRARPRSLLGKVVRLASPSHSYHDKNEVLEACRATDLVLFSEAYWPAAHIAEYLDVPCVAACVIPFFRTGEFPRAGGPVFLHRRSFGRRWNRFTHWAFERALTTRDLPWLAPWRRQLGLPAIEDQAAWAERRRIPRLYGHSELFLPRPRDWPEWHHVTGYWYWDDEAWRPPPALERFLDARAPTVFVGFASSILEDADVLETAVLPAIRSIGCRAVVGMGWSNPHLREASDVFVVESCPFGWLFPRVSVVLHASGASTVAEVLRAGKPSVCLPMFGDQRFFAARLEKLGLAPRQLPLYGLTAARLTGALELALGPEMRSAAATMGSRLAPEDGPARALAVMEGAGLLRR